jgi:phenylpyruvate tautomerase PptA (4-oxalocrotonate tautomerase family)
MHMPTYVCRVCGTDLDSGQKSNIAREITRLHSEHTGAPHFFAQVFFEAAPRGSHFIGGVPSELEAIFVRGDIRAGRSVTAKRELVAAIVDAVHRISGIPTLGIWVYLNDLPAAQMVEFGRVLPEPGEEKAWMEAIPTMELERIRRMGKE